MPVDHLSHAHTHSHAGTITHTHTTPEYIRKKITKFSRYWYVTMVDQDDIVEVMLASYC